MPTPTFDTLAYADKLKQSGFSDEQAQGQARALAEVVYSEVATRPDLNALEIGLRRDLNALEERLNSKIETLGTRLDGKIDALAARLDGKIDNLEDRTKGRFTLLQWMLAFNLALTAAVLWLLIRAAG